MWSGGRALMSEIRVLIKVDSSTATVGGHTRSAIYEPKSESADQTAWPGMQSADILNFSAPEL